MITNTKLWILAFAITLLIALVWLMTFPADAQRFDYPHPAFVPYGAGGPQYRGDYYGTYRDPIPWYTAPVPRSGFQNYRYMENPQAARPFLPGLQYRGPRYNGWW